MIKKGLLTLLLTITSVSALAGNGWFGCARFGQPFYSDTHPDCLRIDASSISMNDVYDYGKTGGSRQTHVFGTFGFNVPIWKTDLSDRKYGLSVSAPLSATLWMDIAEPVTSAIVNTDYRIASPSLTFIHRFPDKGFLKNYSVELNPFKHESTHIGDELALSRVQEKYALKRVNVSYNYLEIKFALNEPEIRNESCQSFKASVMIPYGTKKGWYFVEERDGDVFQVPSATIVTDKAGYLLAHGPGITSPEWYFQYQWQTRTAPCGIQGIVSAELRGRAMYGYDLSIKEPSGKTVTTSDKRSLSVNFFAGLRYNGGSDAYLSRAALGIRAYFGNCPYGQFRSIPRYSQIGLCLMFM